MATKIVAVKIVHDTEWQEWQVHAYVSKDGHSTYRYPNADYFTDDKDDANSTALCMLDMSQANVTLKSHKVYSADDVRNRMNKGA